MKKNYVQSGRSNQKLGTRNKILDSAQYFLKRGMDFNLEDIAKNAGISRATIYRYFSNIDVLAAEAALDVSTKTPDKIYENLKGELLGDKILEIQDHYNTFTLKNEKLFRKYLSTVLNTNTIKVKRGARRIRILEMVLADSSIDSDEKKKLINLLTILIGIEPMIVAKDVCNLNDEESKELLRWGMNLILQAALIKKS